MEKNIKKDNYNHVNRILNAWNKVNYDFLKENNNFLELIYFNIMKTMWNHLKIKDNIAKKEIGKYIDSWFLKKDYNDFKFNLGNDLNKYLSKKYGKHSTK